MAQRLRSMVDVRPGEIEALLWAVLCFFCLLAAYYILRPVRDAMGIARGAERLPWYFLGTLAAMIVVNPLFSALVSHFPRRRFVPVVYHFFAANLLVFFVLFRGPGPAGASWLGPVFYVWTAVFSLFVVSVFWALLVDMFSPEQGKRLFSVIAVGGTLGAIAGATYTASLVKQVGTANLLLLSTGLLEVAVLCVYRLTRGVTPADAGQPPPEPAERGPDPELARGGALGGIARVLDSTYLLGLCAYMLLFTITSTFLYFEQGRIVADGLSQDDARTAFFARIDQWTNILALTLQVLVTGRLLTGLGVAPTAALLPLLTMGGFVGLLLSPALGTICWFQVTRRATDYAVARPTREVLFTVVRRDEKYKAKSLIDTLMYRGGDVLGALLYPLLRSPERGWLVAGAAVPLALLWAAVSVALGLRYRAMAAQNTDRRIANSE